VGAESFFSERPTLLDFLGDLKRTHMCGALCASDAGKKAVLMGWVNRRRDLGSIIFIDLRDRTGVTQVVFNRETAAAHDKAEQLRNEYVIAVIGTVKLRDANTVNKNIPTGEVELVAEELRVLNDSKQPPFLPGDTVLPNEEMRLKYRYIDLRRDAMQFNIETRHKVTKAIRDNLSARGFFEIETPFMTRSTPEGARDYLVPSRVQPGSFYALPQSPQMFKQILMISGFDRYFQIVRCFRDEDFRADRQAEFTQIDLEMTYPQVDTVWEVVESFVTAAFKAGGYEIKTPFPRMSYDDAIRKYGNDKPDMRLPAMVDVREALTPEELDEVATKFRMRKEFPLQAIRIPHAGDISGTERRTIGTYGAYNHVQGPSFVQLMTDPKRFAKDYPAIAEKVAAFAKVEGDDLWLLAGAANRPENAAVMDQGVQHFCEKCGFLRLDLAQKYAAKHKAFEKTGDVAHDFRFLWVSDFPMFEWDKDEKRWNPAHHPFTTLHEEDFAKLDANIDTVHDPKSALGEIRALAYDVVLNGTELGSGSIRIHRQDVQRKIFQALGMNDEEARARFGFFLEALEYGTPPHGGIALGLDRIVMILAGADNLREVIPFPKTARAVDLMVDAPTPVSEKQLKELGIAIRKPKD
jgi:aspartyl-tRNA synthetase